MRALMMNGYNKTNRMKAKEIYNKLKSFVAVTGLDNEELITIAKWIEANFQPKRTNSRNDIDQYTLDAAILKFGADCQIRKAIEELTELSLALQHYVRDDGHKGLDNVIDEAADASIVLEQIKSFFGRTKVNERIGFKMARLRERILKE